MKRPPAIVVGLDCATGLQTARTLAARGVPVVGIASDLRHPCVRTRSCRTVRASDRGPGAITAALLDMSQQLAGAVLVPCTDLAVLDIARDREALAKHFRMAIPHVDVVETLLDKARFAAFARSHDLPVPDTRVVEEREDLLAAAEDLRYPCVLKPSIKSVRWSANASVKAATAASPRALIELYDRYAAFADTFVVQAWIEGGDDRHYTCDCYLDGDGSALVTFTARKLRQWPPVVGQGCLSVEHRNEPVRRWAMAALRAAGHHGMGYLEIKHDARTGRHLIIEVNVGRPTGRSATAEKAGVELLMTMYNHVIGAELPVNRHQEFRGVKWIHVRRDLQACVQRLVKEPRQLGTILRSWRGSFAFALFSLRDPVPFVADFVASAGRFLRGVLGTLRIRRRVGPATERSRAVPSGESCPSPARPGAGPGSTRSVDFDVSGVLRVRALDAGPQDLATIERLVGGVRTSAGEDPDSIVCFVDDLAPSRLGLLDGGRVAWGDDGLYFLDAPGGSPQALVRRGRDWGRALIVCRRGTGAVPALTSALDMAALSKGWIPLHASAWVAEGVGVVVAGWSRSGKTGAFLSACLSGATPVGDDRIFLSRRGHGMVGLGRLVTIRDWHLAQLDPGVVSARRLRRWSGALGRRIETTLLDRGSPSAGDRWRRWACKAVARARRLADVRVDIDELSPAGLLQKPARADVLILLETHDQPTTSMDRVHPDEAARLLASQVELELAPALRTHLSFEHAYPQSGWIGMGDALARAAGYLPGAVRCMECFRARQPYPPRLAHLDRAVSDILRRHVRTSAETAVPSTTSSSATLGIPAG